jgi:hypothetical protein
MKIKLKFPPKKINLSDTKEVLSFILGESFLKDSVVFYELISSKPFEANLIIDAQTIKVPMRIRVKQGNLHFETTITSLTQTQAMLLQINMWSKPVETNMVYPYAMCNDTGEVVFTVSGALPLSRISVTQMSKFLMEFIDTCAFVVHCNFEFGKDGPPSKSKETPEWVENAMKQELAGPRSAEFILDSTSPDLTKEDSPDDHPNQ